MKVPESGELNIQEHEITRMGLGEGKTEPTTNSKFQACYMEGKDSYPKVTF